MKANQFTHASRTYLFVEASQEVINAFKSGNKFTINIGLPKGDWQLIGIVKDIQDFEPLVKSKDGMYLDYEDKGCLQWSFTTAKESFASLLRSNEIYAENPYGDTEPIQQDFTIFATDYQYALGIYRWKLKQWQQVQSKVVGSMVLLIKEDK